MDISLVEIIGIVSGIAIVILTIFAAIYRYCIHVELRFKKLEDEIAIFKPFKDILEQKGEEHVKTIFRREKP